MQVKQALKEVPVVGHIIRHVRAVLAGHIAPFRNSEGYWKDRYEAGGHSGDGSYNQLAEFKAETLNTFVSVNGVQSVIEYGCGDGNQLSLAHYPTYVGFDISPNALARCSEKFRDDKTKTFKLMQLYNGETAQLTISLDVVYHLVEDDTYETYMNRLFDSSERYVIIYSSNTNDNPKGTPMHIRHRNFSNWVAANRPEWALAKSIPNIHPFNGNTKISSFADFYIYEKIKPTLG